MEQRQSSRESIADRVPLLAIALMFGMLALSWNELPDQIPRHFSRLTGRPDRLASKTRLLIFPCFALVLHGVLSVAARHNEPVAKRFQDIAAAMKAIAYLLVAYGQWASIQTALGRQRGLGPAFVPFLVLLIVVAAVWWFARNWRERSDL